MPRRITAFGMQMLEFMDARVGHIRVSVIYDGRSLVVIGRQRLAFEVERSPGQLAEPIIEITIDWPGVNHELMRLNPFAHVKEIDAKTDIDMRRIEHPAEHGGVAVRRQPFVFVREIVGFKMKAHW